MREYILSISLVQQTLVQVQEGFLGGSSGADWRLASLLPLVLGIDQHSLVLQGSIVP